MHNELWVAERRLLGDEHEAHSWLAVACAKNRDEVEMQYHLQLLHLRGHEMRLLEPGGNVVRHHRDTSRSRLCIPAENRVS